MGARDSPDMYALGPAALGLRAYISGISLAPMLQLPYGRKLWRSKSFANLQLWIFGEKYFGESVIIGNIAVDSQIFLIQVL